MKERILVRRAVGDDADTLEQLARTQQISDDKLENSLDELSRNGFITWGQTSDSYRTRADLSDYFLVAQVDQEIIGWVMAYPLEILRDLQSGMSYEDKIVEYFLDQYPLETVFIDQICTIDGMRRCGVATALDEHLRNIGANKSFVTDIIHGPIRNEASNLFFKKIGFIEVAEVPQDQWFLGIYDRRV